MDTKINCLYREKTFSQRKSLYVHCRKFHDTDVLPVKELQCEICQKRFSTPKTLSVHIKKFHNKIDTNNIKKNQTRIIRPYDKCVIELFTFVKQRQHLFDVHGFNVELENINFCDTSGKK